MNVMNEFVELPSVITVRKSLCLSLLILLLIPACGKKEEEQAPNMKVAVLEVVQKDVPLYMELVGQTIGSLDIAIRARVDGTLEGMHFTEGKSVEKGDLLYTIDSRPFEAKVVNAKSKLAEEKTKLAKAENDLKRVKPLAAINAVSKRDLDAAIAQEGAAQASVEAAKAALEFAEIELSYTKIEAPVSGLIGISEAKVGDYVGKEPNPIVLNMISQIDPIHVRATISEREYLQFARRVVEQRENKKLEVEEKGKRKPLELILADGSTHDHIGYSHAVDSQVDPSTGTLRIEAAFPNPQQILRPGQYAKIRVVYDTLKGALLVPQRAVQELQGLFRVYVVGKDNKVELREVTPGEKVESLWVIDKGLEPGDRVVVKGLQRVQPGTKVEPVSSDDFGVNLQHQGEASAEESENKAKQENK